MTISSVDRNIMFGVLAVQQGWVSSEQIQKAFGSWVKDKSIGLSQILRHAGTLTEQQCGELETLVASHFRQLDRDESTNNYSVNRSLTASLKVFVEDNDIQAFLKTAMPPGSTGVSEAPVRTHTESWSTGRFHILRPHAKGGLGEVFVARDVELGREVALKQILSNRADNPELIDRFLREGEITGKLEHPGIVPVYGMGRDDKDHPYYVMRLIRGKSLRDAINEFHVDGRDRTDRAEKRKRLRSMLNCFVDICQAIAYAHSRGVLHRDLKPANIMLGPYGETLVVDWGLARMIDAAEGSSLDCGEGMVQTKSGNSGSHTIAGTAMGTPAYMSPEQAQGRLDLLTPRSDIYSLGATLYSILTGKPSVAGSGAENILTRVIRGQIQRPRALDSSVPKPLDAICAKAMALNPGERYETALDLASDIEAWLADSPVSAWQEPLAVRGRRWIRNHQGLAFGTAAAIVVALISSLIASAFLSSKNQQLFEATELAQRQAKIANEQSELSLSTMTQVIKDIQAVFESRSAPELMTRKENEARENMLRNALEGMKKVSEYLKQRTDYGDTLVVAHVDLGNMYLAGGVGNFEDGRERALAEFQSAMTVCERWIEAEPDSFKAQRRFAEVAHWLGRQAWFSGENDEAVEWCKSAVARAVQMTNSTRPKDLEIAYHILWNTYYDLGTIEFRRFDLKEAEQWYLEASEVEALVKERDIDIFDQYAIDEELPEFNFRLSIVQSLPTIRKDLENAFNLPKDIVARALYDCAAWQATDGDHQAAFNTLQRIDKIDSLTDLEYYSNACGYGRCVKALLGDRSLKSLSKHESELAEMYSKRSIGALRNAKKNGYFEVQYHVGTLGRDPDFDALRDRNDFKLFVAEVRKSAQ